jgi:hypothetical protein
MDLPGIVLMLPLKIPSLLDSRYGFAAFNLHFILIIISLSLVNFIFKDELGRLTLNVCQTVAHGVLVFLPSYRMLQVSGFNFQQKLFSFEK